MSDLRKELISLFFKEDKLKEFVTPLIEVISGVQNPGKEVPVDNTIKAMLSKLDIPGMVAKTASKLGPAVSNEELKKVITDYKSDIMGNFLKNNKLSIKDMYGPVKNLLIDMFLKSK